MLHTKRDVELLADYAASTVNVPPPQIITDLKIRITADKAALANLDSSIMQLRGRMKTSIEVHNALLERHNELVDKYEHVRSRLNMAIDQYNALDVEGQRIIIEIGGGINLEPSKFAIRQNDLSPKLIEFKSRTSRVGLRWTETHGSEKWIRSGSDAKGALTARAQANDQIAVADRVKHWMKTDARDGSWKAAVRLDASRAQEKSYNSQQQTLQVAEFAAGQLQSLIVGKEMQTGGLCSGKPSVRLFFHRRIPPCGFRLRLTHRPAKSLNRRSLLGRFTRPSELKTKRLCGLWFGRTRRACRKSRKTRRASRRCTRLVSEAIRKWPTCSCPWGPDVKAVNHDGWTALHYAANENMPTLAQALIDKSAAVDAKSADGKTPLDLACDNQNREIIKVLIHNGAKLLSK